MSYLNRREGGSIKKKDLPMNKFLSGIHKKVTNIVENEAEYYDMMKNLNRIKKGKQMSI